MCIVLQVWILRYFISKYDNTNEKHLSSVSLSGTVLVASSGRHSFGSLTWELIAGISCSGGGWVYVRIHFSTRRYMGWFPPPPPFSQQHLVGHGLLIIEASLSNSDTMHSVGPLWTSDQPDAETSTWQDTQHSQETDIHDLGGIRTRNPSQPAAADPRLRQRGHWDRPLWW
jgi:hypothetical protein